MRSAMITIKDVANHSGFSVGTVSRVINGHPSVTKESRAKIQESMAELGFQPNAAAKQMRTGKTKTVAIAVRDCSIPATANTLRAAEEYLRSKGYTVLLANTRDKKEVEMDLIREFSRRRVDGVIMTLSDENDPSIIEEIDRCGVPFVFMGRETVSAGDKVHADLKGGTRSAVEYLISLGHTRIAMVTGSAKSYPATGRIEGYNEAFQKAGITPPEGLVRSKSFSGDFAFSETISLVNMEDRPTAIISGGMAMLSGVLRALKTSDLAPGKDISVIAGCDSDLAELYEPGITAVSWDFNEIGLKCAEILTERMSVDETYPESRKIVLPSILVLRRSCTTAPEKLGPKGRIIRENGDEIASN